MTDILIAVVLCLAFLLGFSIIEWVFECLYERCKPFKNWADGFFESLPMWWD